MPKLVADKAIPFLPGVFEAHGWSVEYLAGNGITRRDLLDADALIVRTRTRCDEALLEGTPVRAVASATIGTDHLDLDYLARRGIAWANAAGCNAGSVAQYIESALLHLALKHRLTLRGKVLGIIGLGNVGSRVARLGAKLGMTVLANDPPLARGGHKGLAGLSELLARADFVTMHVPLERGGDFPTFHLAGADFLRQLKPESFLLNSSRGEVVDGIALKAALRSGHLAGAVLDVWEDEPALDVELLKLADYGTPHIAGYSSDGKANGTAAAVRFVAKVFGLGALAEFYPAGLPERPRVAEPLPEGEVARLAHIADTYYDIRIDDAALRAAPGRFEELRNHYRERREAP